MPRRVGGPRANSLAMTSRRRRHPVMVTDRAWVAGHQPGWTPTWREIEEFCRKDGWELIRSTDHAFFRKVLLDGSVLETHRSFADGKTISPGRLLAILRTQLKVSQDDFWETLRTGRPAPRPSGPPPRISPAIPAWMARILLDNLELSDQDIAGLSEEDARRMVEEFWSRPDPGRSL